MGSLMQLSAEDEALIHRSIFNVLYSFSSHQFNNNRQMHSFACSIIKNGLELSIIL